MRLSQPTVWGGVFVASLASPYQKNQRRIWASHCRLWFHVNLKAGAFPVSRPFLYSSKKISQGPCTIQSTKCSMLCRLLLPKHKHVAMWQQFPDVNLAIAQHQDAGPIASTMMDTGFRDRPLGGVHPPDGSTVMPFLYSTTGISCLAAPLVLLLQMLVLWM